MSGRRAIEALLADASKLAKAKEARASWVRRAAAALRKAQLRIRARVPSAFCAGSEPDMLVHGGNVGFSQSREFGRDSRYDKIIFLQPGHFVVGTNLFEFVDVKKKQLKNLPRRHLRNGRLEEATEMAAKAAFERARSRQTNVLGTLPPNID